MARGLVTRGLSWPDAQRVVPSPDAPVAAFAALVDGPRELELLLELEGLTNPLAREAANHLPAIPPTRRYHGALAGLVMLPFVLPRASRFSDGFFGVLYAADVVETALVEAAHHAGGRLAAAKAPAGTTLRLYGFTLDIRGDLVDARRGEPGVADAIYEPDSWLAGQAFGRALRAATSLGLHYTSVRHPAGSCVGLFWPDGARNAAEASRWLLFWNGTAFEYVAQEYTPTR
ncbi:MAG TPA: RES family NAD+ phosphorylase [Candidatus Baltobacteraceae bacterium]|nr:RES family NAD+ phosphorylase [Candidatus Baltobacteraceae bacterium]